MSAGQPEECQDTMARSLEVRTGGASRDPIADMRWALGTQPPDFLALVSLVQRIGQPVLSVVDEQSQRTPLHVASLYAKIAYAAMLVSRGADIEARDSSDWSTSA
jgi:Ankyrin repeat